MEREFPSPGLLSKCLQQPRMGQAKPRARCSIWAFHVCGRDSSTWAIICCFQWYTLTGSLVLSSIPRIRTRDSHVECKYPKQWFNHCTTCLPCLPVCLNWLCCALQLRNKVFLQRWITFQLSVYREILWSWKFGVLKWTKSKCLCLWVLARGTWG